MTQQELMQHAQTKTKLNTSYDRHQTLEEELALKEQKVSELTHLYEETSYQLRSLKEVVRTREAMISETHDSLKTTQNSLYEARQSQLVLAQKLQRNLLDLVAALRTEFSQARQSICTQVSSFNTTLGALGRTLYLRAEDADSQAGQRAAKYYALANSERVWKERLATLEDCLTYEDFQPLNEPATEKLRLQLQALVQLKNELRGELAQAKQESSRLARVNQELTGRAQALQDRFDRLHEAEAAKAGFQQEQLQRQEAEHHSEVQYLNEKVQELRQQLRDADGFTGQATALATELQGYRQREQKLLRQLEAEATHLASLKEKHNADVQTLDRRIEELEEQVERERKQKENIAYLRQEDFNEMTQRLEQYRYRMADLESRVATTQRSKRD